MHAVVRNYSGKGTKALFDLLEKNKGEVESLIRGVKGANIPGMDDGIAAGKCRERLRPQQAMGVGNRANGSPHARPDYKRSRVRR